MADLTKHSLSYSREEAEKIYARAVWGLETSEPMRLGVLNKTDMALKGYTEIVTDFENFHYLGNKWSELPPEDTAKLFYQKKFEVTELKEKMNSLQDTIKELESILEKQPKPKVAWWINFVPKYFLK